MLGLDLPTLITVARFATDWRRQGGQDAVQLGIKLLVWLRQPPAHNTCNIAPFTIHTCCPPPRLPPATPSPQQELTKKQAAELCALFRSKLEGGQRTRAASATNGSLGLSSGVGASGSGSSAAARQFVPAAAPAAPAWAGGASSSNGVAPMEAELSGPPDMGGKTFAQLQAEEERAARKAAKAAAKQPTANPAAAAVPRPGALSTRTSPPTGSSSGPVLPMTTSPVLVTSAPSALRWN